MSAAVSLSTAIALSNGGDGSVDADEENGPLIECKWDESELRKTATPLLNGSDVSAKREEIRQYFHKTFSLYESLFSVLASDESFYQQPEPLRHPLIFYWGHTAVFFINKLRLAGVFGRIDEQMESTMAVGVDEMSWDDLNTSHYNWPSVSAVRKYRDTVRITVDDLIGSLPLELPITWSQPFWIILMGIEHERIHLETSSVLFRQLDMRYIKKSSEIATLWTPWKERRLRAEEVPSNALVTVPGGKVVSGKKQETQQTYGWDLEYGHFSAEVSSFRCGQFLVSNAEFLEFVRAGGYEDEELWGEEGWKFVQYRQAKHPVFWVPVESDDDDDEDADEPDDTDASSGNRRRQVPTYRYRTMCEIIDMPMDWPVDCNYIEAKAFCAWKNKQRAAEGTASDGLVYRLPTEAEYFRLRDEYYPESIQDPQTGERRVQDQPFWARAPGNINMEYGASSCPIDRFPFQPTNPKSEASEEVYDVIGNVWAWTETPIMPFRGFAFHPMYDDFSVPTFDTRHNVFVGGSWISTGNEATRLARYAFRRHFYQHAGFRYVLAKELPRVEEGGPGALGTQLVETDSVVTKMMDAQFNDAAYSNITKSLGLSLPNFSQRIATFAVDMYKKHGHTTSDLDVGAMEAGSISHTEPATLTTPGPRAIDIGCGCGRSTLEIAKLSSPAPDCDSSRPARSLFNHILGLDFSTRFIRVAAQLQFHGHAEYNMRSEGELLSYHTIDTTVEAVTAATEHEHEHKTQDTSSSTPSLSSSILPSRTPSILDLDLSSRHMLNRVEFMQGDACNLSSKFNNFDLVLASNLLECLYTPTQFLRSISSRMRVGGILVLASTYNWDEKITPKCEWLGGLKDGSGESVDSLRTISDILSEQFENIKEETTDLPVLIKEDVRNFQLKFSQVTVWRRK